MATRPSESMTSRGTAILMWASSQVDARVASVHPPDPTWTGDGNLSTGRVHRVVHIHTGIAPSLWTVAGQVPPPSPGSRHERLVPTTSQPSTRGGRDPHV